MELNLEPVKVDLQIETPSLERGAFYSLCFITENDEAPRTLKVERLKDLLDNGYDRSSLAYNFCVGVFAQQGIPFVYVRAKRSVESYSDAFSADDNSNYYFVVIESKEPYEVSKFNEYLISKDDFKLQFYSNNSKDLFEVNSGKLVNYYQEVFDFSEEENYYLNKAYKVATTHKYASHPYPVLVDEDSYRVSVKAVSITKRTILKTQNINESYEVFAKPKSISVRSTLLKTNMDDGYSATAKPKSIVINSSLIKLDAPHENYIVGAIPKSISRRDILIVYSTKDEAYIASAKPKSIKIT